MSYLAKRARNNITYLYEIQGYRNRNTGKVKHKEKCLGKLDSDGTLITCKRKIPAKILMTRKIITKFNLQELKENKKQNKNSESSADVNFSRNDIGN